MKNSGCTHICNDVSMFEGGSKPTKYEGIETIGVVYFSDHKLKLFHGPGRMIVVLIKYTTLRIFILP